jgi:hypothetical protein
MKKEDNLEAKIKAGLSSLDGMKPASPGPYFFTRLQARLASPPPSGSFSQMFQFFSRPSFAFSFLGLILFVNAFVLFHQSKQMSNPLPKEQTELAYAEEEYTNQPANAYYEENMEERK